HARSYAQTRGSESAREVGSPTRGEASRQSRSMRPHAGQPVGTRGRPVHTRGSESARQVVSPTRGERHRHARSARPHAGTAAGTRAVHYRYFLKKTTKLKVYYPKNNDL